MGEVGWGMKLWLKVKDIAHAIRDAVAGFFRNDAD